MSDFVVLKKTFCAHAEDAHFLCGACLGLGYVLTQVDLEEAVIEVLVKSLNQHSRLSRLIRQTSREVMYK